MMVNNEERRKKIIYFDNCGFDQAPSEKIFRFKPFSEKEIKEEEKTMNNEIVADLMVKISELWTGKSSQDVTEAMAIMSAYLIDCYPEEYKESKMNEYFQRVEYILKNHKPKAFQDSHQIKQKVVSSQ